MAWHEKLKVLDRGIQEEGQASWIVKFLTANGRSLKEQQILKWSFSVAYDSLSSESWACQVACFAYFKVPHPNITTIGGHWYLHFALLVSFRSASRVCNLQQAFHFSLNQPHTCSEQESTPASLCNSTRSSSLV